MQAGWCFVVLGAVIFGAWLLEPFVIASATKWSAAIFPSRTRRRFDGKISFTNAPLFQRQELLWLAESKSCFG